MNISPEHVVSHEVCVLVDEVIYCMHSYTVITCSKDYKVLCKAADPEEEGGQSEVQWITPHPKMICLNGGVN